MANDLQFKWRFGDYELRAVPKRLVRVSPHDKNETVDFVKWYKANDGHEYCRSIGYFHWDDHEPWWTLKFAGNRFAEVPVEDIAVIWPMLKAAYETLTKWKEAEEQTIRDYCRRGITDEGH